LDTQDELEELLERYEVYGRERAIAEAEYRSAYAGAYLRSGDAHGPGKVPVKEREAYAHTVTKDALQAFLLAEAMEKFTREALYTKRSRLDVLRTLNANLRPLVSG